MRKNSLLFGIALGLVFPLLAYLLYFFKLDVLPLGEKKITFYIIAALLNLLMMRYYYRHDYPQTASGVVLITFIAAISLFFLTDMRI